MSTTKTKKTVTTPKETVKAKKAAAPAPVRVKPVTQATGRRKTSIARILLRRGSGKIMVNQKNYTEYFDTDVARLDAARPFVLFPIASSYDVEANVTGGGIRGQAGAIKLGIARALFKIDERAKEAFKQDGLLTVDSRQKERKKYGQRGARRKFQFVKR